MPRIGSEHLQITSANINALRTQAIGQMRRLIPDGNIRPQAGKIFFSQAALERRSNSIFRNICGFLHSLEGLLGLNGLSSSPDRRNLFRTLSLKGLGAPADASMAGSEYAHQQRYFLNLLGCDFAYNKYDQLVIGTKAELRKGAEAKEIFFNKRQAPVTVTAAAERPEPRTTVTALAQRTLLFSAVGKRELRFKKELEQTIGYLMTSGQPELAAAVLFSANDRSLAETLGILDKVIENESFNVLMEGYSGLKEANALQIGEVRVGEDTARLGANLELLLGYIIGRYSTRVPFLAGKILKDLTTLKGLDFTARVVGLMESRKERASAIQGLTGLGEFKTVNRLFKLAAEPDLADYSGRLTAALDELKRRDSQTFFDASEYKNEVYRNRPKKAEVIIEDPQTTAIAVFDPERARQEAVYSVSPDIHLRDTVKGLLNQGQTELAGRVAFDGYSDIILRFESLLGRQGDSDLSFYDLGRLLYALPDDRRSAILVDLSTNLDDGKHEEIAEEIALAMIRPKGAKNPETAGDFFHKMIVEGAESRLAARKIILTGLLSNLTVGDYGAIYDRLGGEYPETYENDDWHDFIDTGGCVSKADVSLEEKRGKALEKYFKTLSDGKKPEADRLIAAQMLRALNGKEYRDKMIALARKLIGKIETIADDVTGELLLAIYSIDAPISKDSLARAFINYHLDKFFDLDETPMPMFSRFFRGLDFSFLIRALNCGKPRLESAAAWELFKIRSFTQISEEDAAQIDQMASKIDALSQPYKINLANQLGIEMKALAPGPFTFQGDKSVAFKGCKLAQVPLTNGQFRKLLELEPEVLAIIAANPQARLEQSLSAVDPDYKQEQEDAPMVFIEQTEAGKIAKLLGKRLPTELEWERAAAYTDGRKYPFGDTFDESKVTFNGKGTRSVYAHKDGANPEGVLDLPGNVWEWTASYFGQIDLSSPGNPKLPISGSNFVLRGGSWNINEADSCAAIIATRGVPDRRNVRIGCRFAED